MVKNDNLTLKMLIVLCWLCQYFFYSKDVEGNRVKQLYFMLYELDYPDFPWFIEIILKN